MHPDFRLNEQPTPRRAGGRHLSRKHLMHPAGLAALLVLSVYIWTLAPSVFTLDGAELTTAAYTLGLAHPPGYPVYLLLLHLFQHVPFGDIGYRSNLFSAVASAGAVACVAGIVYQLCRHWWAALVAGLSFGWCFYTWSVSVFAEVYTFQSLLLAGMLLLLWHWQQSLQRRWVLLTAALMGLALANNPATLLWWPGLLLLAWAVPWRQLRSLSTWLAACGVGALALLPVLYLPWRSTVSLAFSSAGFYDEAGLFHTLQLTDPHTLLWYLSGGGFKTLIFPYTAPELLGETLQFLHELWAAFLGIGLPLGVWGWWAIWQHHRRYAVGLVLAIVPHMLFFIGYHAPDKNTMFLPVFLVWAVLLGAGVARAMTLLPRGWAWVSIALPLALLGVNSTFVNVNDMWAIHDVAHERLTSAEPGAVYFARWGDAAAMQYHQAIHGVRPDVTVVNIFLTTPHAAHTLTEDTLRAQQSVYITHDRVSFVQRYQLVATTHGYRVYK
jgi:hypothetical protein